MSKARICTSVKASSAVFVVVPLGLLSNAPFSAYVAKWDIRKMDDAIISLAQNTDQKWAPGINWVVMRYSDILLYAVVCFNS